MSQCGIDKSKAEDLIAGALVSAAAELAEKTVKVKTKDANAHDPENWIEYLPAGLPRISRNGDYVGYYILDYDNRG